MIHLLRKLAARETSGIGLAMFRISYSLVVLCELAQLFYFRDLVFDEVPGLVHSETNFTWLLLAWMVVVGCLLVGFQTRGAAILNYVLSLGFFSVTHRFEYHVDYAITALNFLVMFMPADTPLSIDGRRPRSASTASPRFPALYNYLLVFSGVGIVYLDSIFHKLASPMWLHGLGLWLPASFPNATWVDLTPLLNQRWLVIGIGYLTLVFEALFIFLFPFRRFQPALVIIGLLLHLGIVVAFPIPFFGLAVVGLYFLIFPDSWWRCIPWLRAPLPTGGTDALPEPVRVNRSARWAAVYLAIIVAGQAICLLWAPLVVKTAHAWKTEALLSSLQGWAAPLVAVSRPLLGIVPHGVFMDSHFEGYNHVIGIAYVKRGQETWLPLITEDTRPGFYNTGRFWVNFTFRVNAPQVDPRNLERGLRDYTAFWADKNGVSLRRARFLVYVKKIGTPTGWEKDFLRRQRAMPWKVAGDVEWRDHQCTITLPEIETL